MPDKLKSAEMDVLFKAMLSLESVEECYAFFEDLCTVNELKSMAQRLQVALLLDKGETYTDIVSLTGASTATISRVNRCLNYGTDGYSNILKKLSEEGINGERKRILVYR